MISFKQSLRLKCASVEREEHLVDRDSSEPVGQTLFSRVRFDRNLAFYPRLRPSSPKWRFPMPISRD